MLRSLGDGEKFIPHPRDVIPTLLVPVRGCHEDIGRQFRQPQFGVNSFIEDTVDTDIDLQSFALHFVTRTCAQRAVVNPAAADMLIVVYSPA